MTEPIEAAKAAARLGELMKRSTDARLAVSALVSRAGYSDILEWAREHPDEVVEVVEGFDDLQDQAEIVEGYLKRDIDPPA